MEATVDDPRGLKRICLSCGTRFFDLNKRPIVCPSCGVEFTGEVKIKTRRGRQAVDDTTEESQVSPATESDEDELEEDEIEEDTVSLEDADEISEDTDDDEDIDVDLDDDNLGLDDDDDLDDDIDDDDDLDVDLDEDK